MHVLEVWKEQKLYNMHNGKTAQLLWILHSMWGKNRNENCEIDMSKVAKVNQQCTEYISAVRKPT